MHSGANQGKTEGDLSEMGTKLANEIMQHVRGLQSDDVDISFIGYSLGGLIIRAALPHLH